MRIQRRKDSWLKKKFIYEHNSNQVGGKGEKQRYDRECRMLPVAAH